MDLRQYQTEAIEAARRAISQKKRSLIIQAATGSGKTIIAAEITRRAIEKGNNVLFLVNKRDLVYQAVERFSDFGLGGDIGVIMNGEEPDLSKPVQIGTIQSYHRRNQTDNPNWMPWFHKAQLAIIDEAHSSVCRTYMDIIKLYKEDAIVLGLTATPARGDGRGLGVVYQDIISVSSVSDLTQAGYLVPMFYYSPDRPDLSKIKIARGDYDIKEVGAVMDKPKLIGNVLDQWAKIASERQTIIFAVNVKHSKHIRDLFEKNGVKIAHVDAHTPSDERAAIFDAFNKSKIQVLTNVNICSEGSDFPVCSAVVIARPTKQYSRYIQMAGRGLRPFQGKKDCILIDHAGCVYEHGFVDEPVSWTLSDKEKAWKKKKKPEKEKKLLSCDECRFVFCGPVCPQCGLPVKDYGKKIEAIEADLVELGKGRKKATAEEKRRFFGMLEFYRRSKGYAPGYSAHKYREKFSCWPRGMSDVEPIEIDHAFLNWIKHLAIKQRKERERDNMNISNVGGLFQSIGQEERREQQQIPVAAQR